MLKQFKKNIEEKDNELIAYPEKLEKIKEQLLVKKKSPEKGEKFVYFPPCKKSKKSKKNESNIIDDTIKLLDKKKQLGAELARVIIDDEEY
jgi:hypothetical protein